MNLMNRLEPIPWSRSNGSDARTPDAYLACLKQFNFDSNDRYLPEGNRTFCNIAASDSSRALGCYIPHTKVGYGSSYQVQEYSANQLQDWLFAQEGTAFGWQPADADLAKSASKIGQPTLVTWKNPYGDGHIAWVLPDWTLGQAGAKCGYGFAFSSVFTSDMMPQLKFFVHL